MNTIRRMFASLTILSTMLAPLSAYALDGSGPRVNLEGEILQVNLTEKQVFEKKGGELVVKAENGQTIQVVLMENAKIITEGRLSRRSAIPSDLKAGMHIRIRGLRLTFDSVSVSLVILTNIEKNPGTNLTGILTSISDNSLTILDPSGRSVTYGIDNGTKVEVQYNDFGRAGLNFIGKRASVSFSRANPNLANVIRISLPGDID